jgi:hypothetical protein
VKERVADAVRVHLTAPASREPYVEVFHFPDLTPGEEYARHRTYLEERFGPGAGSDLRAAQLGERPAWAYTFRWDEGERAVLLVAVGGNTERLTTDPRAPLTTQVLATVTLAE